MPAKVLVVEDNKDLAQLYSRMLNDHFDVTILNSLHAVKAFIRGSGYHIPDLALVDIQLSDGTFPSLLLDPELKEKIDEWKKIYVSAYDDMLTISEAFAKGAHDYITKPFNENELLSKCQRALLDRMIPTLNPNTHEVKFREHSSLPLTSLECRIYNSFSKKSQISKEELISDVWQENIDNPKIAVHISRLRKKLHPLGWSIEYRKKEKQYYLTSVTEQTNSDEIFNYKDVATV